MHLSTFQSDDQSVTAGYACPCGCTPSVTYERGGEPAGSLCCCGNEFVVGPDAERSLQPHDGFVLETEPRLSGWGESVTAAWLVGPSVHPEPVGATDGHDHGHDGGRKDGAAIDHVCGMRVEPATAVAKGLHRQHDGVDHYFCGKGCYLDFGEDPARYLDPSYIPSI
jgi:YHS domain-containing protein